MKVSLLSSSTESAAAQYPEVPTTCNCRPLSPDEVHAVAPDSSYTCSALNGRRSADDRCSLNLNCCIRARLAQHQERSKPPSPGLDGYGGGSALRLRSRVPINLISSTNHANATLAPAFCGWFLLPRLSVSAVPRCCRSHGKTENGMVLDCAYARILITWKIIDDAHVSVAAAGTHASSQEAGDEGVA